MKSIYGIVTALAVLAFAADAQANCGSCAKDASKAKPAAACAATGCDAAKGCPIAAAMGQLPTLTYSVGQKEVCCPKQAAKLAKESGGHVHFCVAGKEFDSESAAQAVLLKTTEKFVAAFAKPHKCPKSGQVTLAGAPQNCEKTAARTAKAMQDAMAKVKFTYAVGDQECGCPVKAGKLSEESGKPKVFVLGDEKTCCEKTAKLNLARAKYRAAVQALVQAQGAETKPTGS